MSIAAARSIDVEQNEEEEKKKPGRPRSNKSRRAILTATNKLLLQHSVRDLSIEAIAKKAKVGKTTIYRWWPNKVAVVLDAVLEQQGTLPNLPTAATFSESVSNQLGRFTRILKGKNGKAVMETLAEAQSDRDMLTLFYERFMLGHEQQLADLIDEGKAAGEFRQNIDTALAVDMIYGAVIYHFMSGAEMLDDMFIDQLPSESIRLLKA